MRTLIAAMALMLAGCQTTLTPAQQEAQICLLSTTGAAIYTDVVSGGALVAAGKANAVAATICQAAGL